MADEKKDTPGDRKGQHVVWVTGKRIGHPEPRRWGTGYFDEHERFIPDNGQEATADEIAKHKRITYYKRVAIEQAYATIAEETGVSVDALRQFVADKQKAPLTDEDVRRQKDRLRLEALEMQLAQRLATAVLPGDGLKNKEQYLAAGRLATTFQEITKLQKKLGLAVSETPQGVKEARRLRTDFDRKGPGAATRRAVRPNLRIHNL